MTLRPEKSEKSWHQPTGMIGDDGRFTVFTNGSAGAPPGNYRVVVFVTEPTVNATGKASLGLPKSLIPARYNLPEQSPLKLKVVEKPGDTEYDLELKSNE